MTDIAFIRCRKTLQRVLNGTAIPKGPSVAKPQNNLTL